MIDETPHATKQVYTPQAGCINNFNLGVGVIDVVAQSPRDDGITRRFFPLHGTSEFRVMAEKQRQVIRRGKRANASAANVPAALVLERFPRTSNTAATSPKGMMLRNFVRSVTIPID
jgi:hypothetical protein